MDKILSSHMLTRDINLQVNILKYTAIMPYQYYRRPESTETCITWGAKGIWAGPRAVRSSWGESVSLLHAASQPTQHRTQVSSQSWVTSLSGDKSRFPATFQVSIHSSYLESPSPRVITSSHPASHRRSQPLTMIGNFLSAPVKTKLVFTVV